MLVYDASVSTAHGCECVALPRGFDRGRGPRGMMPGDAR
jgi:hypothetical protein